MKSEYDLLVIGGGPGGAIAARTAAEAGLSVCLVEKRPAIGAPVRCAEGIGKKLLHEFIEPDERWIASDIRRARIIAPDGTAVSLEESMAGSEVGYVIERKIFDRELVWNAAEAGSDVFVKTRASAPIMEGGTITGAIIESCGETRRVHADVTIAADGVESKFARWCGINTTVPLREMMTCAQYLLTNIDIDQTCTDFYLGNYVAPEGYLWIFPKGRRSANVGIGISGRKSTEGNRAKDRLDRFVKERFPEGKIIEYIIGGDPVCEPLDCTVADGLMIIGDAARVVDPLTGGGIYNSMFTGRLAAGVAAKCISGGLCSRERLMEYDETWRRSEMGRVLERNYRIKEFFITLSDHHMNTLAKSLASITLSDFSVKTLVKELTKRNPALLMKLNELKTTLN